MLSMEERRLLLNDGKIWHRCSVLGLFHVMYWNCFHDNGPAWNGSSVSLFYGLICFMTGFWMFLYSTVIKSRHADVILKKADIAGDKHVLDAGTGRGLLAIAAAKIACRVTAIDVWSNWDLAGNNRAKLENNIASEKVTNIKVADGDVRELAFSDGSFDIVASNFVIHNIKNKAERKQAINEMWRVLRPQGCLVISDIRHQIEYEQVLAPLATSIESKRVFTPFLFLR